mmetsp:Transcript_53902/g.139285  ORF Transcript_53902/g.139285 Transcript_53902/m.139285 type:complete len:336 (+) Transcript_53902:117-1124(+)
MVLGGHETTLDPDQTQPPRRGQAQRLFLALSQCQYCTGIHDPTNTAALPVVARDIKDRQRSPFLLSCFHRSTLIAHAPMPGHAAAAPIPVSPSSHSCAALSSSAIAAVVRSVSRAARRPACTAARIASASSSSCAALPQRWERAVGSSHRRQTVPATNESPAPRVLASCAKGSASNSSISISIPEVDAWIGRDAGGNSSAERRRRAQRTPLAPRVTSTWRQPARTSALAAPYTSVGAPAPSPPPSWSVEAMATASSSFGLTTAIASSRPAARRLSKAAAALATETGSSHRGVARSFASSASVTSAPPSKLASATQNGAESIAAANRSTWAESMQR